MVRALPHARGRGSAAGVAGGSAGARRHVRRVRRRGAPALPRQPRLRGAFEPCRRLLARVHARGSPPPSGGRRGAAPLGGGELLEPPVDGGLRLRRDLARKTLSSKSRARPSRPQGRRGPHSAHQSRRTTPPTAPSSNVGRTGGQAAAVFDDRLNVVPLGPLPAQQRPLGPLRTRSGSDARRPAATLMTT